MKHIAGIIMSIFAVNLQAQYTVKITITGLPATPAVTDVIYLAGNFNNWNPQDDNYRLQKNGHGQFFIELKGVDAAAYEFKFTRGSWNWGETDGRGSDLPNRTITIQADTALEYNIAGWKDGSAHSTASPQVTIIDTAFAIPELDRQRRIWVYLPKGYGSEGKRYPVLYMHDGQNLFDNTTSFAGEWGIDETMDSLKNPCIVIGIDNGGIKRMNEYNPENTAKFGKGEGRAYLGFIVHRLKPFIDKKYNTLRDKKHTYMAGSSMGGLISFYAGLYYPDVFGVLGIFSPSFWINPQISTQVKQLAKKTRHGVQQYYFYVGGAEDKQMVAGMQAVASELKQAANLRLITVVNPDGMHNEATWSKAFPAFYGWIHE